METVLDFSIYSLDNFSRMRRHFVPENYCTHEKGLIVITPVTAGRIFPHKEQTTLWTTDKFLLKFYMPFLFYITFYTLYMSILNK